MPASVARRQKCLISSAVSFGVPYGRCACWTSSAWTPGVRCVHAFSIERTKRRKRLPTAGISRDVGKPMAAPFPSGSHRFSLPASISRKKLSSPSSTTLALDCDDQRVCGVPAVWFVRWRAPLRVQEYFYWGLA